MKWVLLLVLFLPVLVLQTTGEIRPSLSEGIKEYTLDLPGLTSTNDRLLIYLPTGYLHDKEKKWPVLVYLHGASGRGTDPQVIRKEGPLTVAGTYDLPMIIIAPQCLEGYRWNPLDLNRLLRYLLPLLRYDRNRVWLTGKSMGGVGTWEFATQFPDYFAAVVPVCGTGDPSQAVYLKNIPVWAFHGALDRVIPPEGDKKMVKAIRQAGGEARLTIFPDGTHQIWDRVYKDRNLYTWLLSQAK